MAAAKVAISMDRELVWAIDQLVRSGEYASRSQAIQTAVMDLVASKSSRERMLRELSNLDSAEEQSLADEGLDAEQWPKY